MLYKEKRVIFGIIIDYVRWNVTKGGREEVDFIDVSGSINIILQFSIHNQSSFRDINLRYILSESQ